MLKKACGSKYQNWLIKEENRNIFNLNYGEEF